MLSTGEAALICGPDTATGSGAHPAELASHHVWPDDILIPNDGPNRLLDLF